MPYIHQDFLTGGRVNLALRCNALGLKTAVEIGTDRGVFARAFLDHWRGEMLYCVDPYEPYEHMPWDRTPDLMAATLLLYPHLSRVRIMKATSGEAASYFRKGEPLPMQVGFVYLDGNHSQISVAEDIHLWWPLVQPGGILAGDDFGMQHPGVREAVMSFIDLTELPIYTISDYNRELSWYIQKPPQGRRV